MGGSSVPAFFIISGFYMSLILTTKYKGRDRIWLFYTNRALRLYPMYWALLLVCVALAFLRFDSWPLAQIIAAAKNPLLLAIDGTTPSWWAAIPNLAFVGADVLRVFMVDLQAMALEPWLRGVAEDAAHRGAYQYLIAPPIWSLGVEVIFYVLAPLIAALSVRNLLGVLLGFCALHWAVYYWTLADQLAWYHLLTPYNACYFVTGMVAHRVWPRFERLLSNVTQRVLISVPFILWACWQIIPSSIWTSWLVWLLFASALPCLFQATKHSRLDAALSTYSYPVYLCHILFAWPMTNLGNWAGIAAFILSVGVSWVLIRLVDAPVEAWRQRRALQHSDPLSATLAS